jgi:hypothetical protein
MSTGAVSPSATNSRPTTGSKGGRVGSAVGLSVGDVVGSPTTGSVGDSAGNGVADGDGVAVALDGVALKGGEVAAGDSDRAAVGGSAVAADSHPTIANARATVTQVTEMVHLGGSISLLLLCVVQSRHSSPHDSGKRSHNACPASRWKALERQSRRRIHAANHIL